MPKFLVKKPMHIYHPTSIIVLAGARIEAKNMESIIFSISRGSIVRFGQTIEIRDIVTDKKVMEEYLEELPY